MSYFQYLMAVVAVDSKIYDLVGQKEARKIILINLLILGAFFGMSNLVGVLRTTPDFPMDGIYTFISPLIFAIAGTVSMCGAMVGGSLIYWAAARALSAQCGLFMAFSIVVIGAAPFWIIAPLLNYAIRISPGALYNPAVLLPIAAALALLFRLMQTSFTALFGIGPKKAGFAVIAMWIFGVSAVYVFIP